MQCLDGKSRFHLICLSLIKHFVFTLFFVQNRRKIKIIGRRLSVLFLFIRVITRLLYLPYFIQGIVSTQLPLAYNFSNRLKLLHRLGLTGTLTCHILLIRGIIWSQNFERVHHYAHLVGYLANLLTVLVLESSQLAFEIAILDFELTYSMLQTLTTFDVLVLIHHFLFHFKNKVL